MARQGCDDEYQEPVYVNPLDKTEYAPPPKTFIPTLDEIKQNLDVTTADNLKPLPEKEILIERANIKIPAQPPHNKIFGKKEYPDVVNTTLMPEVKPRKLNIPIEAFRLMVHDHQPPPDKTSVADRQPIGNDNQKFTIANLKTVNNYALSKNISKQAVFKKIKNKKLIITEVDGVIFINVAPKK